jgi:drug/metabolite transporter (DMT)-like permease
MRAGPATAATLVALACFAANSLLARAALGPGLAGPGAFTGVRLVAGALALLGVSLLRGRRPAGGSWGSALALFGYAAAFSLAYVRIPAGAGALLLFAAVQATMIGWSIALGTLPTRAQALGVLLALAGLAALTRPGASAPDALGAALMALAGVAWGAYSLRGRGAGDPIATTADNFVRAAALAIPFALLAPGARVPAPGGVGLAVASGALASAGGYCLWYAVVPALGPTRAAAVQLAVPVLAAGAAVALLGEPLTARLALSGVAIVSGIALAARRG